MHSEDPHGARGSTEHHALTYKGSVKQYSSADILASFNSAESGQASGATVASKEKPAAAAGSEELDAGSSTEQGPNFHALNWKKEVKAFSSADLMANMAAAMGGKDVLNGAGDSLRTVSAPVPAAPKPPTTNAPTTPTTPDAEAGLKVRSWLEEDP